jgi:hypothetical protein
VHLVSARAVWDNLIDLVKKTQEIQTHTHIGGGSYEGIGDGIYEFTGNAEVAYLDLPLRVAQDIRRLDI